MPCSVETQLRWGGKLCTRLIAKVIRLLRAKFHRNRLTTVQDIRTSHYIEWASRTYIILSGSRAHCPTARVTLTSSAALVPMSRLINGPIPFPLRRAKRFVWSLASSDNAPTTFTSTWRHVQLTLITRSRSIAFHWLCLSHIIHIQLDCQTRASQRLRPVAVSARLAPSHASYRGPELVWATGRLMSPDRGFGTSCLLHCGHLSHLTVSANNPEDSWKRFYLSRTRLRRLNTLTYLITYLLTYLLAYLLTYLLSYLLTYLLTIITNTYI